MTSEHVADGSSTPAEGNGALDWAKIQRFALICAGVGLGVYILFGLIQMGGEGGKRQFFLSYLTSWLFWLSLPVGCMAWLGITYVTGASWGILLSRLFEAATRTLPLLILLFIPIAGSIFSGEASPYPWSRPASDWNPGPGLDDLQAKFDDWSNPKGFLVRAVIYFAFWAVLIYFLNKWSARVEEHNDLKAKRFTENLAGPVIVAFAVGNIFASTDFAMSLENSWASTMFPLIYCINQLLTCLVFCVAIFMTLSTYPSVKKVLRPKFQLDMGSMMLALTMVWSYMSFCQFLLVWVGNLPEEIPFFLKRTKGGWEYVSRALCVLHFALPFLLLLFRDIKLHPRRLRAVAILILAMCAIDVIWWVEPAYEHPAGPLFLFMDIGAIAGIGGIWMWMFINQLKKRTLLPNNYLMQLPGGHHGH